VIRPRVLENQTHREKTKPPRPDFDPDSPLTLGPAHPVIVPIRFGHGTMFVFIFLNPRPRVTAY